MTPFEGLRGDLYAQVGNHLGDTISVTLNDGSEIEVVGFTNTSADGFGTEGLDPGRIMNHVKIDKTPENIAVMPNGPRSIARLTCAKFAGLYKPAAATIDDDGFSWVFDVQKATALP